MVNHIIKVIKVKGTLAYNEDRMNNKRNARLGINEHASPEVGEAFSTMGQASPMLTDEDGASTQELSFNSLPSNEIEAVLQQMLALSKSEDMLGAVAQGHYKRLKGLIPYAEHHASVVGKDGDDTVTFENYNRDVESDTLQADMWDSLFEEFDLFGHSMLKEIHDIREALEVAKSDQTMVPSDKFKAIFTQKKAHLKLLRESYLRVAQHVGLKVKTNLGEKDNNLWHFNMYGPLRSTYINEAGEKKPQSFHEVWSPSIPNAITVRTTGLVNQGFKVQSLGKLKTRIGQVAYHRAKLANFANQEGIVDHLFNLIVDPVLNAKTRIEAADMLQQAREELERLENFLPLEGEEARQADLLVTNKYIALNINEVQQL